MQEQVKAFLFTIALFVHAVPVPEKTVAAPGRRSGEGRIDMAWVDENGEYIAVFEIDQSVKQNSISKLRAIGYARRRYIISMAEGGAEKLMGSPS